MLSLSMIASLQGAGVLLSLVRNLGEFPAALLLVLVGALGVFLGVTGLIQTRSWPRRVPAPRRPSPAARPVVAAPRTQAAPRSVAVPPPRSDTDRLQVEFPAIGERHPDVWAPGEPLDVVVSVGPGLVGPRASATVDVAVVVDGRSRHMGRAAPDELRRARFHVELGALAGDAGTGRAEAHVVARLEVDGRASGQAVRGVRIVPYREEIVETFEDFLKWAAAQYAFVDRRMTAREFVDRFADAVPAAPVAPLDRIVDIYELANYSDHPVDRALYLEFVDAFLELEDVGALEGPAMEAV